MRGIATRGAVIDTMTEVIFTSFRPDMLQVFQAIMSRYSFGAVCAIPGFLENSSNHAVSFGCPGRHGSEA
jgi:hypothetical protein